jgi:hypothetical protein
MTFFFLAAFTIDELWRRLVMLLGGREMKCVVLGVRKKYIHGIVLDEHGNYWSLWSQSLQGYQTDLSG